MLSITRCTHPLIKMMNNSLIDLPAAMNLSYWWNYGSLLGMCLVVQILTGLFLSMHYNADVVSAFNSLSHICRDANHGWVHGY